MTDTGTLVERLFAVIDSHRWADVDTVLHVDARIVSPLFPEGVPPDGWVEHNRSFAVAVPAARHTITHAVVDGERCAFEALWTGQHTGPMAGPGGEVPASGRSISLPFCGVAAARDGRISELTVYFDQMAMLAQLGLVPDPAVPEPVAS
jgi:predicted ester cyclase